MTTAELDKTMTIIGADIPDTPQSWAQVALACLDQGGFTSHVQDKIAAVIRLRTGIESEPDDGGHLPS